MIDGADVGPHSLLVARPGGAWFISSERAGGPIHVHKLEGDELTPMGAAVTHAPAEFDVPVAACTLGDRLAILTLGREIALLVTDGVGFVRTSGSIDVQIAPSPAPSIACAASGDAIWVALPLGATSRLARVDVLPVGDARPAERVDAGVEEKPRGMLPRWLRTHEHYRFAWGVHAFLRTFASLHVSAGKDFGEGLRGPHYRMWSTTAAGDHHRIMFCPEALVAVAFDPLAPPHGRSPVEVSKANIKLSRPQFERLYIQWPAARR